MILQCVDLGYKGVNAGIINLCKQKSDIIGVSIADLIYNNSCEIQKSVTFLPEDVMDNLFCFRISKKCLLEHKKLLVSHILTKRDSKNSYIITLSNLVAMHREANVGFTLWVENTAFTVFDLKTISEEKLFSIIQSVTFVDGDKFYLLDIDKSNISLIRDNEYRWKSDTFKICQSIVSFFSTIYDGSSMLECFIEHVTKNSSM